MYMCMCSYMYMYMQWNLFVKDLQNIRTLL